MTEARNCENCGVTLSEEASFCKSCGASVHPRNDMKCQTCGNDNPADAQLCGGCGVSLSVPTVNESGTAANGNRISIRLGEIFQTFGYLLILLGFWISLQRSYGRTPRGLHGHRLP